MNLPQYSARALFEAIVNAVVHRDYSILGSKSTPLDVRRPRGGPIAGLPAEQPDPGEHGSSPGYSQRGTDLRAGADAGGRNEWVGRQAVHHGAPRGTAFPIILRETRELSGKQPEYCLIDNSEVLLTIPAAGAGAEPRPRRYHRAVRRTAPGRFRTCWPSSPTRRGSARPRTKNGEAELDLHTTHLPMIVFAAAPDYAAYVEREWVPSQGVPRGRAGDPYGRAAASSSRNLPATFL